MPNSYRTTIFFDEPVVDPNCNCYVKGAKVNQSFLLTKILDCEEKEYRDIVIERFDRLKTEDFNRVKVPQFEYTVEDNIITYTVEYIKGYAMGTLPKKQSDIIYEDVVMKDSDWTFVDYHAPKFILASNPKRRFDGTLDSLVTDEIYSIDLLTYRYAPNRDKRNITWNQCQEDNNKYVDSLGTALTTSLLRK